MIKKFFAIALFIAGAAISAYAQDYAHAVSLFEQKQTRAAIREFHAVLKANPDAWQSWYYIGFGHYQLQEYDDTVDAFNTYLKASGKDPKAPITGHYFLGWATYQLQQYDKAIAEFNQYLDLAAKGNEQIDVTARGALGRSYIFMQKYAEAIAPLSAAAAEMKTNASNYYLLGFAQYKLNHLDQATTALNQALAVDPKEPDSLALVTEIYFSQMKQNPAAIKQAIGTGERLIQVRNDERSWALLGQAYLYDQQYTKAAPLLDKYAHQHADSVPAWYNLGVAYSRSNQWKPAEEALEQVVKLQATNLAANLELAYVYESDKQPDKALVAYQRAYDASGHKDETARAGIDRLKQPAK
jgi:tetratricopeptide (TPR) repeat protein